MSRMLPNFARPLVACALVATLLGGVAFAWPPHPGRVDPARFLSLASDEDVRIEVSLGGALLKALVKIDPEIAEMASGIESIDVVVLELKQARVDRSRATIRAIDEELRSRGWERLARIQEADSEVKVLVLSDDERIQGLVVMVVELSAGELIFANVAGDVDLATLSSIGERLDLPGLDSIERN